MRTENEMTITVRCGACDKTFAYPIPDDKIKTITESTIWVTCPHCKQPTKIAMR
jgi:phage FluMu protein Com